MIIDGHYCPQHLKESLRRYRDDHIECGSFLRSCLCGNLFEAVRRADFENGTLLGQIAAFIAMELPTASFGSEDKVKAWESWRNDESAA